MKNLFQSLNCLMPKSGQVVPLTVLFLLVLLGLVGLGLTIGSVFFAQQKLQAAVDAAALAGAQEMTTMDINAPNDQANLIIQDDPQAVNPMIVTQSNPPYTVVASAEAKVPGSFAALFGYKTFTIRAKAVATYGPGPAFDYAVFQGDSNLTDPPLTIHGANIIQTAFGQTSAANVHSNNGLVLRGATIVQGACSASSNVVVDGVGGCSGGTSSFVSQIPMPLWSAQVLTNGATQVIGSPSNPTGLTFNGATQFSGNWVVYGNVNIDGAIVGPSSIVAIGGSITIHGAASFGTDINGLGVCLAALPPVSSPNVSENITIRGAHNIIGILYAPTGTISLSGADIVQGAVIGYQVDLGGAGIVQYDPTQVATIPYRQVALIQ